MEAELPLSRWAAGVASGIAQQQIEAVVSLARRAELPDALAGVDRPVAEALLSMLGNLAATEEPPKTVVRAAAGWLAHKLDVFVEEAVKTAGKTAGVVGVGGAALLVQKHAPGLADQLRELVDLATLSRNRVACRCRVELDLLSVVPLARPPLQDIFPVQGLGEMRER